jgi:hypothetical protein
MLLRIALVALVSFRIVGAGHSIPTTIDAGPCPEGEWSSALLATTTSRRIGTAYGCGLAISKRDETGYGLRWIHQTATETYVLPGGTIRTRETQRFDFARDQHHSHATFAGRVTGGTGRFAGASGTISGAGPAVDGRANYRLTVRLR